MEITPQTAAFIEAHAHDDPRALALQAAKYPEVDMPLAVRQLAARQLAARKIPSWHCTEGLWYPCHLSMEQCSSEATAVYKASLVEGESMADLTGGFGIDCSFLARRFRRVTYVERQEELCELARHNFPLLGLNDVTVCCSQAEPFLQAMEPVDCLFLDPARRDGHGGKTVAIADCEPDVAALEPLLVSKAQRVLVKLSPMLDLSLALRTLKHVVEVHIVAVNNECKELLLVLQVEASVGDAPAVDAASKEGATAASSLPCAVRLHCEHIPTVGPHQHETFTLQQEREAVCPLATEVGTFLYEPNAALLKAGAFRWLAQRYGVRKLHSSSHLYTSDEPVPDFPGRCFRVEAVSGFGKKELKTFLQGMVQTNLTVRNFPMSVAELRKRLKLKEGGDAYIFATTLADERKVLVRGRKYTS